MEAEKDNDVKNILKFEGDEKLLLSAINKCPLACLIFSAIWCPSCRRLAEHIPKIADKYPDVLFIHIDVQKSTELSAYFGVVKIPHMKFVRPDGDKIAEAAEIVGSSSTRLKTKLAELLPQQENEKDDKDDKDDRDESQF